MTMERIPILVVDDNASNAKLLDFLLRKNGYEVRVAVDALDAFKTLGTFRPRAILMDVQLPGMDGLEITRRLKSDPATRDIAIIALTAYAMKGDEERARDAGCDGYVTKPVDTRTFCTTLQTILDAHPGPAEDES